MIRPKLLGVLRDYDRERFARDLTAGIIIGIVALPLAIAFAIASGVSPEKGLITAFLAGFLISAFGGSNVQIGGPTGAFVVIVCGIINMHGLDGLLLATVMAGAILVIMGLLGLGSLVKYIPYPVTVGFTSGIGLIIFTTQVKDFLGLPLSEVPSSFFGKWGAYLSNLRTLNVYALLIGVSSLLILLVWPKISKKFPGSMVVILLITVAVSVLGLPVETIGSQYGEISAAIPRPSLPSFDMATLGGLIGPAFTIAALAAIEALLSATVADRMIGDKHEPNTELVATGLANLAVPFFGGIPATGAIARTATNVKNGGCTPVAGLVHSLVLLLIALFFGKWVAFIPLSALAAILMVVAYKMCDWPTFISLFRCPRHDRLILASAFVLTVVFDLSVAIAVGVLLALCIFMSQMARSTRITVVTGSSGDAQDSCQIEPESLLAPQPTLALEFHGPLFFGTAEFLDNALDALQRTDAKALTLVMKSTPLIDASGLSALQTLVEKLEEKGISLYLKDVQPPVATALARFGLMPEVDGGPIRPISKTTLEEDEQLIA